VKNEYIVLNRLEEKTEGSRQAMHFKEKNSPSFPGQKRSIHTEASTVRFKGEKERGP